MKTFKIVDGDLVFDGQMDLVMVEGEAELIQSIERILTTNINEWFLNLNHGLNYQHIQGKNRDIEGMKLAITEAILQEDRIDMVEDIDIKIDKQRNIIIKAKAKTKTGNNIELSEVINIG